MASGVKYNLNQKQTAEEFCRYDTVFRHSGGFNLKEPSLPIGTIVPPFAPMKVDFKARTAVTIKNVALYSPLGATDTTAKIRKGSIAYVGMYLGNGTNGCTVSAIDRSNAEYDVITISALGASAQAGEVLFQASSAAGTEVVAVANVCNYATATVGAGETVTAVGQAYEISKEKLPAPISSKDEQSLGSRFQFI